MLATLALPLIVGSSTSTGASSLRFGEKLSGDTLPEEPLLEEPLFDSPQAGIVTDLEARGDISLAAS